MRLEREEKTRATNISRLAFLFRTLEDLKILSKCKNMKLFTVVPDSNSIPRLGFYFASVCKVRNVSETYHQKGGIDNSNYKITMLDDFEKIDMRLNTRNFINSMRETTLVRNTNHIFGSMSESENILKHPSNFIEYDGCVLVVGSCFLGDEMPNISFIIPLNKDINYLKYQILEFVNTRRKVKFKTIRDMWEKQLANTTDVCENLKLDESNEWAFFKEAVWDEKIFLYMMSSRFTIPQFSQMLRLGVTKLKLNEWTKHTATYFRINDFLKELYISNEPEKTFSKIYAPIQLTKEVLEQDVQHVSGWSEPLPTLFSVKRLEYALRKSQTIKNSEYGVNDVFSWNNGGKILANRWYNTTSKKDTYSDEYKSAISYIWIARAKLCFLKNFSNNWVLSSFRSEKHTDYSFGLEINSETHISFIVKY